MVTITYTASYGYLAAEHKERRAMPSVVQADKAARVTRAEDGPEQGEPPLAALLTNDHFVF